MILITQAIYCVDLHNPGFAALETETTSAWQNGPNTVATRPRRAHQRAREIHRETFGTGSLMRSYTDLRR